jgi:hypothetical protein
LSEGNLVTVLGRSLTQFLPALLPEVLHRLHHLWQIGNLLDLPVNFSLISLFSLEVVDVGKLID